MCVDKLATHVLLRQDYEGNNILHYAVKVINLYKILFVFSSILINCDLRVILLEKIETTFISMLETPGTMQVIMFVESRSEQKLPCFFVAPECIFDFGFRVKNVVWKAIGSNVKALLGDRHRNIRLAQVTPAGQRQINNFCSRYFFGAVFALKNFTTDFFAEVPAS